MFHANQQIGIYTLIRQLGRGGFGEVWLAEDRNNPLSEKVAIKLPRNDQIDLQAVKDEVFNWVGAGNHKNILPFIKWIPFDNRVALVSEYAPDGSLQDLINKKGSLPIAKAAETIIGILNGLAHLHNCQIIHRDLKPDNILFQGKTPRLTDFGISRALPVGSQSQTVAGTLPYMAPEAFDGKRNFQTDIWSVGVIIYQLLTGKLPFPQKDKIALIGALVTKEPEPLPNNIPSALQKIVAKALAKNIAERYWKADEMAEELRQFLLENSDVALKIPSNQALPTEPLLKIVEPVLATPKPFVKLNVSTEPDESQPDAHSVSSPTKLKSKRHYLAVPAVVLLLFGIIGGGYYFLNDKPSDQPVSSTSNPTPSPTAAPLRDKTGQTILIPFRKGDKWGFSDSNKNIVIEPKYEDAKPFSEDRAAVKLDDKWGVIDKNGEIVIQPKYEDVYKFSNGFAKVKPFTKRQQPLPNAPSVPILNANISMKPLPKVNSSSNIDLSFIDHLYSVPYCQVIDKEGNEIIPKKYESSCNLNDGIISIAPYNSKRSMSGFINVAQNILIEPKYDSLDSFSEKKAAVKMQGKYGFIDKTGKMLIEPQFDTASNFQEGVAVVGNNKKFGFIDEKGNKLTDLIYDAADKFSNGLAIIRRGNDFGFIDIKGNEIVKPQYEDVAPFSNGLARIKKNGKYGFINKTGEMVIENKYDQAGEDEPRHYVVDTFGLVETVPVKRGFFTEGLIVFKRTDKRGFMDTKGNEVFELEAAEYSWIQPFFDGLALIKAKDSDEWKFVDKTGKVVITKKYRRIWAFSDGLALFYNGNKFGFIDKTGKEVLKPEYDFSPPSNEKLGPRRLDFGSFVGRTFEPDNGLLRVWLGDKKIYIDKNGTEYYKP